MIGPTDAIELDEALTARVDWEVELAPSSQAHAPTSEPGGGDPIVVN